MAKVVLDTAFYDAIEGLDGIVADVNSRKIQLLFDTLGIPITAGDFAKILEWDIILIMVPDKQMAVQLNKLITYVPNLKFVADAEQELFAVLPGKKAKRVWKDR